MTRKYRHIGPHDDVAAARLEGAAVAVLCGRSVKPLDAPVIDALPTCPSCARARDLAYAEGRASWCMTATSGEWHRVFWAWTASDGGAA